MFALKTGLLVNHEEFLNIKTISRGPTVPEVVSNLKLQKNSSNHGLSEIKSIKVPLAVKDAHKHRESLNSFPWICSRTVPLSIVRAEECENIN